MNPVILQLAIGQMMNFAYLIVDEPSRTCAVVDPGWDVETIARAALAHGCKIDKILLTHTHYDHARETEALARRTGATVHVHQAEAGRLPASLHIVPTTDGTKIPLGTTEIVCLHTPGHTPGSQCFLTGDAVITGDTLFVDECGRVDLPGSSPRQMVESLQKLARLDPGLTVYPGHDYGPTRTSTIAQQRVSNPYLRDPERAAE